MGGGSFVGATKRPSQRRRDAEQFEELAAHQVADCKLRIAVAGERESVADDRRGPHRAEVRVEVDEVEGRDTRPAGAWTGLEKKVESFGVCVRQRAITRRTRRRTSRC